MKKVLFVGPLPPPVGGGSITFQTFLHHAPELGDCQALTLNTAPPDYRKQTRLWHASSFLRGFKILWTYLRLLMRADLVVIFGTHKFIYFIGLPMLLAAKLLGRPIHLKPFGVGLEHSLAGLPPWRRRPLIAYLNRLDSVMCQTRVTLQRLQSWGLHKAVYLPGCRTGAALPPTERHSPDPTLRLIFLAQVKREKGIFELLEIMRRLRSEPVSLAIYGPLFEDDRSAFETQVAELENCSYQGVASPGTAVHVMRGYDALVFPTRFAHEGHPGVVIEAMQAGIPVLCSDFAAAPELIEDAVNGHILPASDLEAWLAAIRFWQRQRQELHRCGEANRLRFRAFSTPTVVRSFLDIIGVAAR